MTNHQFVDIRVREKLGLEKLGTAILFYLEDLDAQEWKVLEEAEKPAKLKTAQENVESEAVHQRTERESVNREWVEEEQQKKRETRREKSSHPQAKKHLKKNLYGKNS